MFSNVFGCVACCLRWFSWGIPWLCMVQPSVISTCVYVCMGGGPHNFPRVPEYPVAAHAMFRVFGVDSVAHRVPRQTSMLEVSGCGAYCQTCFLDFSRGLSARNVGVRRFWARCAMFSLGFKFSGSGAESGFKSSKMSALFGALQLRQLPRFPFNDMFNYEPPLLQRPGADDQLGVCVYAQKVFCTSAAKSCRPLHFAEHGSEAGPRCAQQFSTGAAACGSPPTEHACQRARSTAHAGQGQQRACGDPCA